MPDVPRGVVVVDTTPIIALSIIGQLQLLESLYGEVWIPPAVSAEVAAGGSRPGAAELQRAAFVRVATLVNPSQADMLSDLDRGEAEVIALARERRAGLVILDERLARRHAVRLGLTVTGALGVLIQAKRRGYVAAVRPLLDQLRAGGMYLDDGLVRRTLELAGET